MRYLLLFLAGLILGAVAAIFFLGAPRAKAVPGVRVQGPAANEPPSAKAVLELNDRFLNDLLNVVFKDLGPPTFNLASTQGTSGESFVTTNYQGGCTNSVTLAAEENNVKTQVQFAGGKIAAPLVFSGNYSLLGNCMQFKGWAQTSIELNFDEPSQTLYGRMNVEGVTLEGVSPVANNFVTVFVRTAIDTKVNPLVILRQQQLQLMIPVTASNGSLKAHVNKVQSEVHEGVLRLHINYDFAGSKGQMPAG